ncbi:MAG: hypothetical protein V1798_08275 [Pseudomonadota bacterium]
MTKRGKVHSRQFSRTCLSFVSSFTLVFFFVSSSAYAESPNGKRHRPDAWETVLRDFGAVSLLVTGGYFTLDAFRLQARKKHVEFAVKRLLEETSRPDRTAIPEVSAKFRKKALEELEEAITRADKKPISALSKMGKAFLRKIAKEGIEKAVEEGMPAVTKLVVKDYVFDVVYLGGATFIIVGSWLLAAGAMAVADIALDASPASGATIPPFDFPKEYMFADCGIMRSSLVRLHNMIEVKSDKDLIAIYNAPSLNLDAVVSLYDRPAPDYESLLPQLLHYAVKYDIISLLERHPYDVRQIPAKSDLRAEYDERDACGEHERLREIAGRICEDFVGFGRMMKTTRVEAVSFGKSPG